jgi:toluene monooxygenase system protein A
VQGTLTRENVFEVHLLKREEWLHLARKLDWEYSYVREDEVFPKIISGTPWLPHSDWQDWEEAFKTSYREYVENQHEKDMAVYAVRDAVGRLEDIQKLNTPWINGLKIHAAALPLAEFTGVVGNLRGARFGRDSAWRTMAVFGALDEFRHTQIPLLLLHELVRWDAQFDWTHKFYHTNNWFAIAARHFFDELTLGQNAIEFHIATNFILETAFTNLQFVGLASLAHEAGDHLFEKMVTSIQTDEARHAQIGHPVLAEVMKHDAEYAQYLVDKWFWRNWHIFSILTGVTMDYFTAPDQRPTSFKEFMEEWIVDQYLRTLDEFGLKKPWYWDLFLDELEIYHHMIYASAYTYRATLWFNFVMPSPTDRQWLRRKYPKYWDDLDAIWERVSDQWRAAGPGPNSEMSVHGQAMPTFCDLCQLPLSAGTPRNNAANTLAFEDRNYIFCSEPCRWIFMKEPERYASHKDLVKRVLTGEAPASLPDLLTAYFRLTPETWGKDVCGGKYDWLSKARSHGH